MRVNSLGRIDVRGQVSVVHAGLCDTACECYKQKGGNFVDKAQSCRIVLEQTTG